MVERYSWVSIGRRGGGKSALQGVSSPPERPFERKAELAGERGRSGSWAVQCRRGPRAAGTARFSASLSRPPAK